MFERNGVINNVQVSIVKAVCTRRIVCKYRIRWPTWCFKYRYRPCLL